MLYECILIGVQIVLESLPVSSTGHLILVGHLLTFLMDAPACALSESVLHLAHLPTLLIVSCFFWYSWSAFFLRIRCSLSNEELRTLCWIIGADVLTFFFFLIKKQFCIQVPLFLSFFITACILFSLFFIPTKGRTISLTGRRAFLLGCVQSLALIPGISRLAAVFTAARWQGFDGDTAFKIAWALQVPLMLGASVRTLLHGWVHTHVFQSLYGCGFLFLISASLGGVLTFMFMRLCVRRDYVGYFSFYVLGAAVMAWTVGA